MVDDPGPTTLSVLTVTPDGGLWIFTTTCALEWYISLKRERTLRRELATHAPMCAALPQPSVKRATHGAAVCARRV
jgi:hypothetical protein